MLITSGNIAHKNNQFGNITVLNTSVLGIVSSGVWNGDVIGLTYGGTGQTTAQAAIDALTNVSAATDEHVLTKDTGTGNAIFKAVAGGVTDHGALTGLSDDDHSQYQKETDFTAGSILFRGASVIDQNNASLNWDNTNKIMRVGGTNPSATPPANNGSLDVYNTNATTADIIFRAGSNAANNQLMIRDRIETEFQYGIKAGSVKAGGTGRTQQVYSSSSVWSFIELYSNMTFNTGASTRDMLFKPNFTQLMFLDAGAQCVMIGPNTDPAELLEVEDGTAKTAIQISNTATDGDAVLQLALSGTVTWSIGVDDGDGDKFKIGTTAIGTNTRITIDSSGNVGIATDAPRGTFDIGGVAGSAGMLIDANSFISLSNNDAGTSNTIFGKNAGLVVAAGAIDNVLIGESAGAALTTGDDNVAIGNNALAAGTNIVSSVAIGANALKVGRGNFNFAIGGRSLETMTWGSGNVALGEGALRKTTTGNNNVGIGRLAFGAGGINNSGSNNVGIGYNVGYSLASSASNNTFIGYKAGDNLTTGSSNIVIGYDINLQSGTGSNQMSIGNLVFSEGIDGTGATVSSGNLGIGVVDPAEKLEVEDDTAKTAIQISNTATDGDAVLQFALSGTVTWSIGVDDGDGDKFKIGTSAIGTNTRMTIDSSGNVGIGTTSPVGTLDVVDDTSPRVFVQHSGVGGEFFRMSVGTSGGGLAISDTATTGISLGYVPIGSPLNSLTAIITAHVNGNVEVLDGDFDIKKSGKAIRFSGSSGGAFEGITYKDTGGSARFGLMFPGSDIVSLANRASNGVVQVRANTSTGGSGGEVVIAQFEDTGVAIGGSFSPAEALEVEDGNATTAIQISNTATDGDPILAFALSGTKTFTMGVDDGDSDKFKIGTAAIGTNTRITIDSSGNVGIATDAPTQKLDVNDDSVRVRTAKTPASAGATGTQGQIAWDANYIYICTASNTWVRAALSTW